MRHPRSRQYRAGVRRAAIPLLITVAVLFAAGYLVERAYAWGGTHAGEGPRKYDPAGDYVGPRRESSNIEPPAIILGRRGIPLVRYDGLGYHSNPVTASQYGLWAYGVYLRDHDAVHRKIALHVADWLVAMQKRGRWFYDFDFALHGVALTHPWSSSLAQGQAMSLLERAYRLTGEEKYRLAGQRALLPLRVDVLKGGLRRCFFGDCTRPFFEEYPTKPPTYVLNGFMFTLIGLYDLASVAPKSQALAMYAAGRRTLYQALPDYDVDGRATYDLTQMTVPGGKPAIASPEYQAVHVYLLRALDSISPNARFRYYASRWQADKATPRRIFLILFFGGVLLISGTIAYFRRTRRAKSKLRTVPKIDSGSTTKS
jgi:heparosan-N-sulfate-glucuronate 5-epimerase